MYGILADGTVFNRFIIRLWFFFAVFSHKSTTGAETLSFVSQSSRSCWSLFLLQVFGRRFIVKSSEEKKQLLHHCPFFPAVSWLKGQGVSKSNENKYSNAVCVGVFGVAGSVCVAWVCVLVQEARLVPLRPTSILTFYSVSWEAKGTLITFSPQASLTPFSRRHHVTHCNLLQPAVQVGSGCIC